LEAFNNPDYGKQKAAKYAIMKKRYDAVKEALTDKKYDECFKALPYNSGYFMCIQLADGLDAEPVRQVLIEKYSIGTISLGKILRIAFSAVAASDIKEMFDGIYSACKEFK
jgi:DNA-binding transcriptional MocR family regulator